MTILNSLQNTIVRILLYLPILTTFAALSQDNVPGVPQSYCGNMTTWNGSSWSNGIPDESKDAVFTANHTFYSAAFEACSLYVLDGVQVIFTQNSNAVISHNIHISNSAQLTFESGSNLVQSEGTQNTGIVTIKRNSSLIKKDAFTLWSSPVDGQTLADFSPETLSNRFYTYNTTDNIYNTVLSPSSTEFETGKGYLIRTSENHPLAPAVWEGAFTGTPHTGELSFPLSYTSNTQSYNAIGNPYPSPISILKFIKENADAIDGTIWLWRKTDNAEKSSYCTVTKLGYQSNSAADTENNTIENPFEITGEGLLNTGQGFIVKAKSAQNIVFKNDMRMTLSSQNFFRSGTPEKDNDEPVASRYWLNLTANNVFSQILIGYTAEATNDYDSGIDGEAIMDGSVTMYTIAGNKKLAIQGRPDFEISDVVKLGFKTSATGTYTFALNQMDGIFANGQNIYLKDKQNNTIHNLKDGSYTFTSASGTFENRFEIVYGSTMGTDNPTEKETIVIYSNNNKVTIQSQEEIASVTAYDLSGRIIFQKENAGTEFTSLPVIPLQVLIINTVLTNGLTTTTKLLAQ